MSGQTAILSATTDAPAKKASRLKRTRRVVWHTILAMANPETSLRCAGVAFFGFMSLFPALGLAVLVFGLLADSHLLTEFLGRLEGLLPDIALNLLYGQLTALISQPPSTLGIGIVITLGFALWSGSRGMDALLFAASRTRRDPNKRPFYIALPIAVAVTVVGAITMLIALALVAALPAVLMSLPLPTNERLILLLRWPLLMGLSILAFAALYRFGPDRRPKKGRWIWPGAVLAAIGWFLVCLVFSLYVEQFANFEQSFGQLSAAVVLMLWMYNSAQVVILGAAFNAQLEYESLAERDRAALGPKGKLPG